MIKPVLSVVIPAFNEERFIGRQLAVLRQHTTAFPVQIIVVDNGSRDKTRELARNGGADLVLEEQGTVAAIRNAGAQYAEADVLMFMDADVFPTEDWACHILKVIEQVRESRLLTGSWVSVPESCSWLEKNWFKPLEHGQNTHMNSGHMIISKRLFKELGGFDPVLRTGEDFDISMRACAAGAKLVDDVSLRVIHEGYPKTLAEFMRREIWHGTGDCQSWRVFFRSKIAVLGFLVVHGQLVGWVASLLLREPAWGLIAICGSLALSLLASVYRYRSVGLRTRIVTTVLYFFYFIARGLSPYAAWRKSMRRGTSTEARH